MILEIQHETHLTYSEPVAESVAEVRMEPASDADQSCRSFHLAVSPATGRFRYQDGFGNHVHHFNVLPAHREVRVLAASVVETHPRPRDLGECRAAWPMAAEAGGLEVLDFLRLRGAVRGSARLSALVDRLRPAEGTPVVDVVLGVSRHIHENFQYARDVTLASSPVDDILSVGKGVCQDFTHLMLALLRSLGIPARYVSGYIHRKDLESQSHAWCEVWLPELGWIGIDPTNDRLVDEHFVKVAIGRDFTDVPPNKGTYRGKAQEKILVRVQTRVLQALPSLSWQEQLPPLNTPLTTIVGPRRHGIEPDDDASQQQQQ
jgi:transglutaminase-like putative cysteine protease